jgi:uncharacterized repeat protein (TIGR03803 family)
MFTNLHSFTSEDGKGPNSLLLSGDTLFGTTFVFGATNNGTIFGVRTNGTAFSTLYSFAGTNGVGPLGGLTLLDSVLYGTTAYGGAGSGTVFSLTVDGRAFKLLHVFNGSDGGTPMSPLMLWGRTLYGLTTYGGDANKGKIFEVDIDGTSFVILHSFSGGIYGEQPLGSLTRYGNLLYGTASSGGPLGYGVVFSVELDTSLSIGNFDANQVLAWPTHPPGFSLQSSTNISSPAWTAVPLAPVVLNGQNIVVEPAVVGQRFYRLIQ